MGSALQRIEVLLVGLVVLFVGAVVVAVSLLHPASPTTYVQATPQSIVTSGAVRPTSAPATAPSSTAAAAPTAAPIATAVLAASSAPSAAPLPIAAMAPAATAAPPTTGALLPTVAVPPIVKTIWPWLLLAGGFGGGAIVLLHVRKRRMTYTNQSIGQLLAAADDVTRATSMRIMRGLAEQGILTSELAAAAGIELKRPHKHRLLRFARPSFPRLRMPALRMPALRIPRPNFFRPQQRPLMIHHTLVAAAPLCEQPAVTPSTPVMSPSATVPARESGHDLEVVAQHGILATQTIDLAVAEPPATAHVHDDGEADPWTAEDRILSVASVLADIWAAAELTSPILALDTAITAGNGQVVVTIDGHPDEENMIVNLPELIGAQRPTWQAAWKQGRLEVDVVTNGARPPADGPLLVPILTHGRGGRTIRFYPLASWRHLGVYGAGALGTLHGALRSLLFNQSPANMALAIMDNGQITPLYRDAAHLIPLPGSMHETVELLAQAIKQGPQGAVRPLVLVVVEPDDTLLNLLTGIVARIRTKPNTPLHLLLVQERLISAGRELYALLPALITSGGSGSTALLPGQGDWPKSRGARLVGRGMRVGGWVLAIDEVDIAAHIAQLRGQPSGLPPVLWDAILPTHQMLAAAPTGCDTADRGDVQWLHAEVKPIAGNEPLVAESIAAVDVDTTPLTVNESQMMQNGGRSALDQTGDAGAPQLMVARTVAPFVADRPTAYPSSASIEEAVPRLLAPITHDGPIIIATPAVPATSGDTLALMNASAPMVQHAPAQQRSRRAALLRAASASGQADAPPLHQIGPHQGELEVVEPPLADAHALARTPEPMAEPDNGWPISPATLGRVAMAELMTRVVQAPAVIAGQANEIGVTKNRLVELLKGCHKAQAKEFAETLLVWFELAGLLVAPTKPGRLRHPRALVTTNLVEIAALLNATPCPDITTVHALWAESNEAST